MIHLGFYNTATSRTHVRFQFTTHAGAGGNIAPLSAFEAADLRIYRANDGAATSATQRSSAAGITMTSPFDSLVGVHDVDIDLADNTDVGFYASGYQYTVMLCPDSETVDGQTITGKVLAYFEIGPMPAVGSVGSISAGGIAAASLAAGALNAIADGILDRNMATGTDSGTDDGTVRTPRQALRASRNKVTIVAGTATITKEDDSTPSWTAAISTTAGNPISGVDPAS